MVGDGDATDDIRLPLVFLFSREGAVLTAALEEHRNVDVLLLPKEKQLDGDGGEDRGESLDLRELSLRPSSFLIPRKCAEIGWDEHQTAPGRGRRRGRADLGVGLHRRRGPPEGEGAGRRLTLVPDPEL